MIQYLEAYCDINEIEQQESLVAIWNALIKNPVAVVHSFSVYAYVIHWFQELLKEKRTVEEFMTMGDISSKEKLARDVLPSGWIEQVSVWLELWEDYANSIVVFDQVVFSTNSNEDLKIVTKKLEEQWSVVYIVR